MADMAGYMTKEGGRFKTWKKRWCVLKNNRIYYSKKQNSGELGIINLDDTDPEAVVVSARKTKKFLFEIPTPKRNRQPGEDGFLVFGLAVMGGLAAALARWPASYRRRASGWGV